MNKEHVIDVIKEYPDMFKITLFKNPVDLTGRNNKNRKPCALAGISESSKDRSVRRTKRILHDYVHCNNFDLFVTFTFNPEKVNRYDLDVCNSRMQQWLLRQRQKSSDFKYIIVPEKHKDGAIHFHALVQNAPFTLKKTKVIQNNNRVYNVTSFRYGFTNAQYLPEDDKQKIGAYIAKYITKDMDLVHGKRRYWASRNLDQPITHFNKMYDLGLSHEITAHNMLMATDFNVIYQVKKVQALFD